MLLALTSLAFAAPKPDLTTTIIPPTTVPMVESSATYSVRVNNIGSKDASGVNIIITLPQTHTSPGTYVLGTLGSNSGCTQSGVTLTCYVGLVKKGKNATEWFDIAFPENAGDLVINATATTTTLPEQSSTNNASTYTAVLDNYDVSYASTGFDTTIRHCTGTSLTSFFECELYPSSISAHYQTFNDDGTLSFPLYGPDYGGTWVSDFPDHMVFTMTELGSPIVEFEGWGTPGDCWEGVATFTSSSTYVSPYEVCVD